MVETKGAITDILDALGFMDGVTDETYEKVKAVVVRVIRSERELAASIVEKWADGFAIAAEIRASSPPRRPPPTSIPSSGVPRQDKGRK